MPPGGRGTPDISAITRTASNRAMLGGDLSGSFGATGSPGSTSRTDMSSEDDVGASQIGPFTDDQTAEIARLNTIIRCAASAPA